MFYRNEPQRDEFKTHEEYSLAFREWVEEQTEVDKSNAKLLKRRMNRMDTQRKKGTAPIINSTVGAVASAVVSAPSTIVNSTVGVTSTIINSAAEAALPDSDTEIMDDRDSGTEIMEEEEAQYVSSGSEDDVVIVGETKYDSDDDVIALGYDLTGHERDKCNCLIL